MSAGFVSLVGAGPGDPDHLTQKAARRLREADVILHDALVSADVRALATRALHINVGKRAGREQTPQPEIERLLIDAARQGLHVVRLKGGDPFVFGRGGEEALALQRAGIPFEVVPGVTTAVGAPALAGIPVTHRGVSSGFVVINGSDLDTADRVLASIDPGLLTIVLLMAIGRRGAIAQKLIDRGWSTTLPAAIVYGAATPEMQTWRGSLSQLVTVAVPATSAAGTIVIGEVAALPIEMVNGSPVSREMAD
jgi:uroporphyrin-III C-methyltransferase / precorrin-2 dehydrogenase / sirohydrochlorin ferrochelatase